MYVLDGIYVHHLRLTKTHRLQYFSIRNPHEITMLDIFNLFESILDTGTLHMQRSALTEHKYINIHYRHTLSRMGVGSGAEYF